MIVLFLPFAARALHRVVAVGGCKRPDVLSRSPCTVRETDSVNIVVFQGGDGPSADVRTEGGRVAALVRLDLAADFFVLVSVCGEEDGGTAGVFPVPLAEVILRLDETTRTTLAAVAHIEMRHSRPPAWTSSKVIPTQVAVFQVHAACRVHDEVVAVWISLWQGTARTGRITDVIEEQIVSIDLSKLSNEGHLVGREEESVNVRRREDLKGFCTGTCEGHGASNSALQ